MVGPTAFRNADDDGDEDEEDEETPMDGKKRIEDMSIDEFLNQSDFDDDDGGGGGGGERRSEEEERRRGGFDEDDDEEEEEEEVSDEDDDDDLKAIERANEKMGGEIRAHKEALGKLKETDPEFT